MHFPTAILIFRHASTATRVTKKPFQITIPQNGSVAELHYKLSRPSKVYLSPPGRLEKNSHLNVRNAEEHQIATILALFSRCSSCPHLSVKPCYGAIPEVPCDKSQGVNKAYQYFNTTLYQQQSFSLKRHRTIRIGDFS